MAPGTSHEAVMLRPKGVPVIVLENLRDFTSAKQWSLNAENAPLLIDPQRGLIAKSEKNSLTDVIKKGWISYPVPLEASVPPFTFSGTFDEQIANLDGRAAKLTGKTVEEGTSTENWQTDCKGLLEKMALGNAKEAKKAFTDLVALLQKLLRGNHEQAKTYFGDSANSWYALVDNHAELMSVFSHILTLGEKKINSALKDHEAGKLKRLYPIKFLEAMIFQKPSEGVVRKIVSSEKP
jgi:hypothetical protein